MSSSKQFTVLVVGDKGVGKTTFIKRITTGAFDSEYAPTEIPQTHTIQCCTSDGPVILNLIDGATDNTEAEAILILVRPTLAIQQACCHASQSPRRPMVVCINDGTDRPMSTQSLEKIRKTATLMIGPTCHASAEL